ncbi:MAG: pyruvate dehydrogenase [Frankia sp.]|nr:pyruvate dehydrogenase [Frankia sp.]
MPAEQRPPRRPPGRGRRFAFSDLPVDEAAVAGWGAAPANQPRATWPAASARNGTAEADAHTGPAMPQRRVGPVSLVHRDSGAAHGDSGAAYQDSGAAYRDDVAATAWSPGPDVPPADESFPAEVDQPFPAEVAEPADPASADEAYAAHADEVHAAYADEPYLEADTMVLAVPAPRPAPAAPAPVPAEPEPPVALAPPPPPSTPAADAAGAAGITPGPPGGVLDLVALAEVEDWLRRSAEAGIEHAERAGLLTAEQADRRRDLTAAGSSVAAVLWFDSLRAEDRVSVTPHAAPLLAAVHDLLDAARPVVLDGAGPGTDIGYGGGNGLPSRPADDPRAVATRVARPGAQARWEAADGRAGRALRATGAGTVGPSGTIWGTLARRFAGARLDHLPSGRAICLLEFAELRDPAVWEAVTDERTPHLGELFWVVLVPDAAVGEDVAGGGQPGLAGPAGAARMFDAAGWQVLTLRFGRRLNGLFQRPGGQALRARLDRMTRAEYRGLLRARGPELRRRLAGPGASGAGIAWLLEALTDDEIHAALRDAGGHDLALLIDAFDEVAADRPTVLFAHTHDAATRAPAGAAGPVGARPGRADQLAVASAHPGVPALPAHSPEPATGAGGHDLDALVPAGGGNGLVAGGNGAAPAGQPGAVDGLSAGSPGARLAAHVAAYLDRSVLALPEPPGVPGELGRPGWPEQVCTQRAFGAVLRGLLLAAPDAAGALVTVSTRDADPVVAGWLDPDGARAVPVPAGGAGGAGRAGTPRRVAGALSPGAFVGVLANLGVAWRRQGVPLLPVGVTDELAAGRVVPAWVAGCLADARSVLVVADTGADPRLAGLALTAAGGASATRPAADGRGGPTDPSTAGPPALTGAAAVDGAAGASLVPASGADAGRARVVCYEPAFAQDLAWCLLAALSGLARADGWSSLLRLSARPIDQRLAGVPADGEARAHRRAAVLAGGYRLRDGGPTPVLTLVSMGAVLPEVLDAADELAAHLGRGVAVVVVTSPDLVFAALRARRSGGHPDAWWVLDEMFPAHARSPLVTVVDGDPGRLAFLAGVHGDRLAAVGAAPSATIVDAALGLLS